MKRQPVASQRAVTFETRKIEIECPVNVKTAAAILGVSAKTLYEWTARGLVPHLKYEVGRGQKGAVRYLPADLLAFRDKFRQEGGLEQIEADVEEMLITTNI